MPPINPYNNPNPYQYPPVGYSAFQPYQQPLVLAPQQNRPLDMIWVQGEAGAKAYIVGPNQRVVLWDQDSPVIYIKSADASGMTTMKILDYAERGSEQQNTIGVVKVDPEYVTKDDLAELEDKFQRQINRLDSRLNNRKAKEAQTNG